MKELVIQNRGDGSRNLVRREAPKRITKANLSLLILFRIKVVLGHKQKGI